MKKLVIIAWMLLLSSQVSAFSDTSSYQWQESIDYLRDQLIVEGYEDGTYQPNRTINRAEFIKIVIASEYDEDDILDFDESCFSDVAAGTWYAPYICLAKEEGIVKGYEDGSFGVTKLINQAEALKIILETYYGDIPNFEGLWYDKYFVEAEYLGMGYFSQTQPAPHTLTRGEMAYLIAWNLDDELADQIDWVETEVELGLQTMEAYECLDDEYYDTQDKLCYPSFDDQWADEDYRVPLNVQHDFDPDGLLAWVRYDVAGDDITLVENRAGDDPELQDRGQDMEIWEAFTRLVPSSFRANIGEFMVMVSNDDTSAYIEPLDDRNQRWLLAIDIAEFSDDPQSPQYREFVATMLHELAHVISLNPTQVDPDHFGGVCRPRLELDEGCALEGAIITKFWKTFWAKAKSNRPSSDFVSSYAATNVVEDLAETFAYFVLTPKPTSATTTKDQKILMMYDFPSLVALRQRVRKALNTDKVTDTTHAESEPTAYFPLLPHTSPLEIVQGEHPGDEVTGGYISDYSQWQKAPYQPSEDNHTLTRGAIAVLRDDVLEAVNRERIKEGAPAFVMSSVLEEVAQEFAIHLTINAIYSHSDKRGNDPFIRAKKANYHKFVTESITWQQAVPSESVNWWKNSNLHWNNVGNPDYTEVGIGIVKEPNDRYIVVLMTGE